VNATLSPRAIEDIFGDGAAPVGAGDRIDTLDFIRGLAVMGIGLRNSS
jgi:uncharacterized protein